MADVNDLPDVRLVRNGDTSYIEVWHTQQPDQYRVTEEVWITADEPGQVDVRHVLAVRAAPSTS